MKVYVTQGHQEGIGLEVFFKTILMMSASEIQNIVLLAFPASVKKTLQALNLPFSITDSALYLAGIEIKTEWLSRVDFSESLTALDLGMKLAESGGVLFTLPTSKDQFKNSPGHTEYFRQFYHREELGMFFSSPKLQVLLLTDHLPIHSLSGVITEEMIFKKLSHNLAALDSWNWPTKKILVSGLNPHAGEKGMIGNEDQRVTDAIKRLTAKLKFDVSGPYPGDTMLLEQKSPNDLLIYLFHDQGLGVFKGLQGFIGSNITLGLPYPRVSPDHGTSFSLFGKNLADYRGCAFSLREAIMLLKRISHGKNSSHQSTRS